MRKLELARSTQKCSFNDAKYFYPNYFEQPSLSNKDNLVLK